MNFGTAAFVSIALVASLCSPFSVALAKPSQSDVAAAKAKLNTLYEKAAEANESLNATKVLADQTNQKISDLNAQIAAEQVELDAKTQELAQSRAQLATVIHSDYKQSTDSLLAIILNASSFDDLVSRVYYINKVSSEQANAINQAQQLQSDVQSKMDSLSNAKANLVAQETQEEQLANQKSAQQTTLQSQVNETQKYLDSLSKDVRDEATKPDVTPLPPAPTPTPSPKPSGGGDKPSSNARDTVMNAARSMVGAAYVYGACDPVARQFDCSGLTMWCFGQAGISLPHNNTAQMGYISNLKSNMSDWQAGDLIIWPSHCGIYMGGGMMIDAGNPSVGVSYRAVYGGYLGAGWPA